MLSPEASALVIEPWADPPVASVVDEVSGLLDRHTPLPRPQGDAAREPARWAASLAPLLDRQPQRPAAVVVVTRGWRTHPDDADEQAEASALGEALAAQVLGEGGAARVIDEGSCRGLAEATWGVGRGLGDHAHIGLGVRAGGARIDGAWQGGAPAWTLDALIVDVRGRPEPLRALTWPESLAASAALHGVAGSPDPDVIEPLNLALGASVGEPVPADVLRQAAEALGVALGGWLNLLDVADLVLHVAPEALRAPALAAIERRLAEHSFASLREGRVWHRPQLGGEAVALGARLYAS